MSELTVAPPPPLARTPEQQRRHRRIQAGRLALVLPAAWAWLGGGFIQTNSALFLVGQLVAFSVPGLAWLYLSVRTRYYREHRFWFDLVVGIAWLSAVILLGVARIRSLTPR